MGRKLIGVIAGFLVYFVIMLMGLFWYSGLAGMWFAARGVGDEEFDALNQTNELVSPVFVALTLGAVLAALVAGYVSRRIARSRNTLFQFVLYLCCSGAYVGFLSGNHVDMSYFVYVVLIVIGGCLYSGTRYAAKIYDDHT